MTESKFPQSVLAPQAVATIYTLSLTLIVLLFLNLPVQGQQAAQTQAQSAVPVQGGSIPNAPGFPGKGKIAWRLNKCQLKTR